MCQNPRAKPLRSLWKIVVKVGWAREVGGLWDGGIWGSQGQGPGESIGLSFPASRSCLCSLACGLPHLHCQGTGASSTLFLFDLPVGATLSLTLILLPSSVKSFVVGLSPPRQPLSGWLSLINDLFMWILPRIHQPHIEEYSLSLFFFFFCTLLNDLSLLIFRQSAKKVNKFISNNRRYFWEMNHTF